MSTDELSRSPSIRPWVQISVGYPWEKNVGARRDLRWQFLRKVITTAAESVEKQAKAGRAKSSFRWDCRRLRATHGQEVLLSIQERIGRSDILAFDISERAPTLLFELGMAYGMQKTGTTSSEGGSGLPSMFVFMEEKRGVRIPSDLSSMLITCYKKSEKSTKGSTETFQLVDPSGFQAAMRSAIILKAIEKGIWHPSAGNLSLEEPTTNGRNKGKS